MNARVLKRFCWWDHALWWYTYTPGGYEGYRTLTGRRLPCMTMADALRDPSMHEEIRRLSLWSRSRARKRSLWPWWHLPLTVVLSLSLSAALIWATVVITDSLASRR